MRVKSTRCASNVYGQILEGNGNHPDLLTSKSPRGRNFCPREKALEVEVKQNSVWPNNKIGMVHFQGSSPPGLASIRKPRNRPLGRDECRSPWAMIVDSPPWR